MRARKSTPKIEGSSQPLGVAPTWDTAIAEAQKHISDLEDRIVGLRKSVQIFERNRNQGETCPGVPTQNQRSVS